MPQIQRETGTSLSEINMVPFIDVVLVLLIIFMITAPILQSGIDVDVPKTKTVKELTESRMVVTIDRSQRVYLNDKPVNIHEIGQQIASQSKDVSKQAVYVRCDETVPFGSWATVVDSLRQSGIQNISVVTQPLNERGASLSESEMASAAAYHPNDSFKKPLSCLAAAARRAGGLSRYSAWCTRLAAISWGGPGGSVTVGLVGNVPAIPLPHPDVSTTSRIVDNTKGLYTGGAAEDRAASAGRAADSEVQGSEAAAKIPPKPTPSLNPAQPPKVIPHPSKILENPTPPPPNAVPYGGGRRAGDSHVFIRHGPGNHAGRAELQRRRRGRFWFAILVVRRGGATADQQQLAAIDDRSQRFRGAARGGGIHDFARRIGDQYSVDAAKQQQFGGYLGDTRGEGVQSVDSRCRAGYSGSNVNVEFYFDFRR